MDTYMHREEKRWVKDGSKESKSEQLDKINNDFIDVGKRNGTA